MKKSKKVLFTVFKVVFYASLVMSSAVLIRYMIAPTAETSAQMRAVSTESAVMTTAYCLVTESEKKAEAAEC